MAVDSGRVPLPGYGHARTCTSKGVIEKVERHAYADVAERWKKLRPDSLSWLVIIPKIEERERRGKGQKKKEEKELGTESAHCFIQHIRKMLSLGIARLIISSVKCCRCRWEGRVTVALCYEYKTSV